MGNKIIKGVNDIATTNPDVIKEYSFELNKKINLDSIGKGSNKKAFWICENGHEYTMRFNEKTRGRGCPYCSGKRLLVGFNDLSTLFPDLVKEWDFEKNHKLPSEYLKYSNEKVWWKCSKCGLEWESTIANRSRGGNGCPVCSKKRRHVGFNDFATLYPDLLAEWDYEKNDLGPQNYSSADRRNVWWKCKKGHSWKTTVGSRINGNGCPYCGNQKVLVGFNDLETKNPDLAKQWNYEKNIKKPSDYINGSNKTVWWKCPKGHEWTNSIYHRVNGQGCPFCSNQKVLPGFNDLESTFPEVLKEWDYEKNDLNNVFPANCLPGSSKKVWWKCSKGHEWEAKIYDRTGKKTQCPICAKGRSVSFPEKTILYYCSRVFDDVLENYRPSILKRQEIDVFIKDINTAIEYDGEYYHKDVSRDLKKDNLCEENGIRLVRIRELNCPKYTSSSIKYYCNPKDKKEFEQVIKKMFSDVLKKEIDVSLDRDEDNINTFMYFCESKESIFYTNRKAMKEWDYKKNKNITPKDITKGSNKKVWWICDKGHEWKASLAERRNGKCGCPYCSNHRLLPGFNDLATVHPEVLEEWNYEKNGELGLYPDKVFSGTAKKVWWKCKKCGYEWMASVGRKVRGSRCDSCSRKLRKETLRKTRKFKDAI